MLGERLRLGRLHESLQEEAFLSTRNAGIRALLRALCPSIGRESARLLPWRGRFSTRVLFVSNHDDGYWNDRHAGIRAIRVRSFRAGLLAGSAPANAGGVSRVQVRAGSGAEPGAAVRVSLERLLGWAYEGSPDTRAKARYVGDSLRALDSSRASFFSAWRGSFAFIQRC